MKCWSYEFWRAKQEGDLEWKGSKLVKGSLFTSSWMYLHQRVVPRIKAVNNITATTSTTANNLHVAVKHLHCNSTANINDIDSQKIFSF